MANNQYIVAIEICSTKIVGALAEKNSEGIVSVMHVEEEKITNCVRHGSVQNVENTKAAVARIIKKLENVVNGEIKDVYLGVNGLSLHSMPTESERNLNESKPIDNEIINSMIKSALAEPVSGYKTIKVVPRTYFVDNNETEDPVGQFGQNINIKINRIVAKETLLLNLDRVTNNLVKVKKPIVTPLAVADAVLDSNERSLGCMLVDMGAETTTVSIYKNNALLYLATIPLGGRNLTRDMTIGMKITEENAEIVKKSIADPLNPKAEAVTINEVSSKTASNYIISRTGEIIANVNAQIEFAGLQPSDFKKIVLVGMASKLKGICKKFEEICGIETRHGAAPASLNILNHDFNRFEYIEVFSIVAKAAQSMPDGYSCVKARYVAPTGDQGGFEVKEVETEQPKTDDKPKAPERKRMNIWKKLKSRVDDLMTEDEEA